jgi:hypothetical protein
MGRFYGAAGKESGHGKMIGLIHCSYYSLAAVKSIVTQMKRFIYIGFLFIIGCSDSSHDQKKANQPKVS